jgi:hypothetical protein
MENAIVKEIKNKYYIGLGSEPNIDYLFQGTESVKLSEKNKQHNMIYFGVDTLQDAKTLQRKYIQVYDLGGGNYVGGDIYDSEDNYIGYISYNGRIWKGRDGWKNKEEIDI